MSPLTLGRWLLLVPVGLGVVACRSGAIAAKLGVPLVCAAILFLGRGRPWLAGRRDLRALVGALVFSAAGDWFLSHRAGRESHFLAGIGLFFVAHLGYLGCALAHGRLPWKALAGALALFLPYYLGWLYPAIPSGALRGAVLGYLLVSCVSWAGAAGICLPRPVKSAYVTAIGLVVFSDTLISLAEFLRYRAWNAWILPTYYAAHVCATWAALAFPPPRKPGAGLPARPTSGHSESAGERDRSRPADGR